MTIETRTTLDFKDIRGIEFECSMCHSKVLIPVEKFKEPLTRCSVCGERGTQWLVHGSADFEDIQNLIRTIRRLYDRPSEGFQMRFEVATFREAE
jgi:DNA replicative helicase MCM subunit Mcm2 (Cdc46/Mcm family)